MFPKNTWYVAAMPADIEGKPLGRQICGQHMVFFRGPEGQVAALDDWCPHRGAPLSLGKVCEGKAPNSPRDSREFEVGHGEFEELEVVRG